VSAAGDPFEELWPSARTSPNFQFLAEVFGASSKISPWSADKKPLKSVMVVMEMCTFFLSTNHKPNNSHNFQTGKR
jgi:hypothetical protein